MIPFLTIALFWKGAEMEESRSATILWPLSSAGLWAFAFLVMDPARRSTMVWGIIFQVALFVGLTLWKFGRHMAEVSAQEQRDAERRRSQANDREPSHLR